MRSWMVCEAAEPLVEIEQSNPIPEGTQVVVAVSHCGLCHSDVTLWKGVLDMGDKKLPIEALGMQRPLTLGHEIVGHVVALGPDAHGVAIGDRRIVFPWVGCGSCSACKEERDNMCQQGRSIGVRSSGGFGSHVVVPHPRHLVDPGDLDPALAATYACSGLTAYSAIRKIMPMPAEQPVVVIGAGGVGQSGIAILRALGHRNVVAVDHSEAKLELAVQAGARATVLASGDDAAERLAEAVGGAALNVIDFVNNTQTAALAFASLGKGGRLVQVGMFGGSLTIPLIRMAQFGISLIGSYVGNPAELRELIDLAREGRLQPIPIERAPKSSINEMMQRLARGDVRGRIVLEETGT